MEAKARQTDIKMTARKLRRVINEVRGKSVVEAHIKEQEQERKVVCIKD